MLENLGQYHQIILEYVSKFGFKIIGAVLLWIIGGFVIRAIGRMTERGMTARKVDATLIRYTHAVVNVILRIALVIAVLSIFGIETTSFAAIIAAAGVAIGMAWSGLLANFAAGIFLMILRPFKVGDAISGGGATGEVVEIGLFASTLNTPDNLRVTVGNNKLLGDNIINFSANPIRRVDLSAQLAHGVDPQDAMRRLSAALEKVPGVLKTPAHDLFIMEFNSLGTKLAVRPFCNAAEYALVYAATNLMISTVNKNAGWSTPAEQVVEHRG